MATDEENPKAPDGGEMVAEGGVEVKHSAEKDDVETEPFLEEDKPKFAQQHHRLFTNKKAFQMSIFALRFAVLAQSISATILQPNFPFIAFPGAHPDSFESTGPFGFSSATYFLPMTSLLGTAIASTFVGSFSDRIGRKPVLVVCLFGSVIGTAASFFARKSFWAFSGVSFLNGLVSSALPVSMAYVSDIHPGRKEKDAEIGVLIGCFMLGSALGGVAAILMENQGLFAPLWVGCAMNLVASVLGYAFLLEPKKMLHLALATHNGHVEEEADEDLPEKINYPLLINIVLGALTDNIGSSGLVPIALSPLAFNKFYGDFVVRGESPIMSDVAFKWISTMVGLDVIPAAAFSQTIFNKIGPAAGCVLGNFLTGVLTIAILFIVEIDPPSNATFGGFIALLYIGFPFTVISQLSTGPMLDRIAPMDRRGFIQGLNVSSMSFTNAVAPWLLGQLADSAGTVPTIWTCIVVSFAACLVNAPLMFAPALKKIQELLPDYSRALKYEDEDLVNRALQGEWVPATLLHDVNDKRMKEGQHFLVIPYRSYEEDKPHLKKIRRQARSDFRFIDAGIKKMMEEDIDTEEKREELVTQYQRARAPPETQTEIAKGLGDWVVAYLTDAGYALDDSPIMYKQMMMQAFPIINKDGQDVNKDNIEEVLLNFSHVLHKYHEDFDMPSFQKAFAKRF